MAKDRYIVVIRKFPAYNFYDIPCFIGQRTYKHKWWAQFVYWYWNRWSYKRIGKIEPVTTENYAPTCLMFGVVHPDGKQEIIKR